MGRIADNVLVATLDDKEVTVLDAGDELHAFTTLALVDGLGQCLVEVLDEHVGILGLKVTAVVGDNLAVLQGDDVTADGEVVVGHVVADAGCLQGTAAFIDLVEVVAENGGVGNFRTRGESFGYRDQTATASFTCQTVHHGLVSMLQWCLAIQPFHSVVGHSVTENNNMFHKQSKKPLPTGGVVVGS